MGDRGLWSVMKGSFSHTEFADWVVPTFLVTLSEDDGITNVAAW